MTYGITRAAAPVSLALVLAAAWAAGCDERRPRATGGGDPTATAPSTSPSDGAASPSTGPAPVAVVGAGTRGLTEPRPGYARVHVTGENGKPITVRDAKVAIFVKGISQESGRKIEAYRETPGTDGTFEFPLETGMYRPLTAFVEVPFNNAHYRFNLHPMRDTFGQGRHSSEGIAQDFEWRLKGLRPKEPADPGRPESWYGASIKLQYTPFRQDLKLSVPQPPPGTKVVFSLMPLSPLVDGSEGKPMTFERKYGSGIGLENPYLTDIPVARYALTGKEVFPDGRVGKILILGDTGNWGDTADGTFAANLESNGVDVVTVRFSRPVE